MLRPLENPAQLVIAAVALMTTGYTLRSLWIAFRTKVIARRIKRQLSGPQMPAPGTRAYARVLFFNKLISIEELDAFYKSHPDAPEA